MILSATLSLAGSGCRGVSRPDFVLKEVTYGQKREDEKKMKARRLAERCRDELARREDEKKRRARSLALYCSWEVAHRNYDKWNARRLAECCRDELARRRRKKQPRKRERN